MTRRLEERCRRKQATTLAARASRSRSPRPDSRFPFLSGTSSSVVSTRPLRRLIRQRNPGKQGAEHAAIHSRVLVVVAEYVLVQVGLQVFRPPGVVRSTNTAFHQRADAFNGIGV